MATKKKASPTLKVHITDEQYESAKRSKSGACLIADSIKRDYPHLSSVSVDMATIRATDRATGQRYIYLTPSPAQHVLLSFDQGWTNPTGDFEVKRAVQIVPITRAATGTSSIEGRKKQRTERLAELETKAANGEILNPGEKAAITKLRQPLDAPERPTSVGPAIAQNIQTGTGGKPTIIGGELPPRGINHPNLLRGTDRHFGAKLADPGIAFREAVEEAVRQRLADG